MIDSIVTDINDSEFTDLPGSEWYRQMVLMAGGVRTFIFDDGYRSFQNG